MKPSSVAPASWRLEDQIQNMCETVLAENPDVLVLQDCSSSDFELLPDHFVRCASAPSHCGHVCIYVRREWKHRESAVQTSSEHTPEVVHIVSFGEQGLPAGAVVLHSETRVCILGVHLAPYESGEEKRQEQIRGISRRLQSLANVDAVLLVGDSNMRAREIHRPGIAGAFEDLGFQLRHVGYEGLQLVVRLV